MIPVPSPVPFESTVPSDLIYRTSVWLVPQRISTVSPGFLRHSQSQSCAGEFFEAGAATGVKHGETPGPLLSKTTPARKKKPVGW